MQREFRISSGYIHEVQPVPTYLLSHGRNQVAVHAAEEHDWPLGMVATEELQPPPMLDIHTRIRHHFDDLEEVYLGRLVSPGYCSQWQSELTAPFTARSLPQLIVVPTAMKSFIPDSVLMVSSGTEMMQPTKSFAANSYLQAPSVHRCAIVVLWGAPVHCNPPIR